MRHRELFRYGEWILCQSCTRSRIEGDGHDVTPLGGFAGGRSRSLSDQLYARPRSAPPTTLTAAGVRRVNGRCEGCEPAE